MTGTGTPSIGSDDATRLEISAKIHAMWGALLAGIIGVGKLLIEAKDQLSHGQWLTLVKNGLPFGISTAQRLMTIARDPRLTNAAHAPLLPSHYTTLYELSKLSDAQFNWGVEHNVIRSDMERADVSVLRLLTGQEVELPVLKREKRKISDEEPAVIRDPVAELRKRYFALCRKLPARSRYIELKRCMVALALSNEEHIAVRRLREIAAENASLRRAEAVVEMWLLEDGGIEEKP